MMENIESCSQADINTPYTNGETIRDVKSKKETETVFAQMVLQQYGEDQSRKMTSTFKLMSGKYEKYLE